MSNLPRAAIIKNLKAAAVSISDAAASLEAEVEAEPGGNPHTPPPRYIWWHKTNPGPEVEKIAAETAKTPRPVRWLPFFHASAMVRWEERSQEWSVNEQGIDRVSAQISDQATAAGFCMLDWEAFGSERDREARIEQMQYIMKRIQTLLPSVKLGWYRVPDHKNHNRFEYVGANQNAGCLAVALHTLKGEALEQYARDCRSLYGHLPTVAYLVPTNVRDRVTPIPPSEIVSHADEIDKLFGRPQLVIRDDGADTAAMITTLLKRDGR